MTCSSCGKGSLLCPMSLGVAVGLTVFFASIIVSLWSHDAVPEPLQATLMTSVWGLVKGFFFGFFVALFYDLIMKCRKCCCKKTNGACGCGTSTTPMQK